MPDPLLPSDVSADTTTAAEAAYTVVARRYRPRNFEELVGQSTIVHALTTAIQTHRVGHAYLFTGARGVGKTSTARIFAKALNASVDGSGHFSLDSDVAQAIDSGEDMDVLEIDGASNRGIDEIRQLRANVAIRPSRSPYKIYIIDEVHMLTTAAFNALLKTLEEPPPHVKFIFCTTDPEKIPITVLSRCQRFDFAPVKSDQIVERLRFICQAEGAQAEEEALQLIARRAAGSMRDSQSLLEQILSFADGTIHVATVHSVLGTADESRLAAMAESLIARDSAAILQRLDEAVHEGIDAGQFGEQLLGYLRDMMAVGVGSPAELLRTASPNRYRELQTAVQRWGTMTLLAAIQILDEALVKMRHSTQSRTLLEVALVQICHLQDLQLVSDLLRGLQAGKAPAAASGESLHSPLRSAAAAELEKKKDEARLSEAADSSLPPRGASDQPSAASFPAASAVIAAEASTDSPPREPLELWRELVRNLEGYVADCASMVVKVDVSSNQEWQILFPQGCDFAIDVCEEAAHRQAIQEQLQRLCRRPIRFRLVPSNLPPVLPSPPTPGAGGSVAKATVVPQPQLIRKYNEHPLVKALLQAVEGEIIRVDPPNSPAAKATSALEHQPPVASSDVEPRPS
jgi:DNA polymerase-3 subunit gamma/tau